MNDEINSHNVKVARCKHTTITDALNLLFFSDAHFNFAVRNWVMST